MGPWASGQVPAPPPAPCSVQTQPCDSAGFSVDTLLPHPPPSSKAVTWVMALGSHPPPPPQGPAVGPGVPPELSHPRFRHPAGDGCAADIEVWRDQPDLDILPSCRGRAVILGGSSEVGGAEGPPQDAPRTLPGGGLFPFPPEVPGAEAWAVSNRPGGGHDFTNTLGSRGSPLGLVSYLSNGSAISFLRLLWFCGEIRVK